MPRPPKPISLHKVEGTYQPSRHDRRQFEPHGEPLAAMAVPSFLTKAQKELWASLLAQAPRGVLQVADWPLFSSYVLHVDALMGANRAQKERPLVTADGRVSPYLRIQRQTAEVLRMLAGELALSPAGRARLGAPVPEVPSLPDNPHLRRLTLIEPGGRRQTLSRPK